MNKKWKKKIGLTIKYPERAFLFVFIKIYNKLIDLKTTKKNKKTIFTDLSELNEIKKHIHKRTDISDHLETLFLESLALKPKLIVELGVRGGESTFALERAAKLSNSKLVSVDLDDCSKTSSYKDRFFVKGDDIKFAKEFKSWCTEKKIKLEIDVLFIDTSHFFKHTLEEINSWFPFLSKKAKVFFHDTRLRTVYRRKDGSIGLGYYQRGVMKAIEVFLRKKYNENKDFVDIRNGWLVKHYANCNGMAILERL